MSRRTDPTENYPSNTKTNPIPPLRSTQGRGTVNPTAGVPQGQTGRTAAQTKRKDQRNTIPLSRQLYREALEAQAGNPQSPVIKTTGQIAEKTWNGQKPASSALPNRRQKQMQPQEKQTLPQGRPKRPDRLWKTEGEESEEERHQRELEEEERRREEREAWEEENRKHWERIEQERKRYEEQQQRRKRWEGFGDQFQDILETGKNALAGEWDKFWDDDERTEYWGKQIEKTQEKLSDIWNFLQDPFAALGNYYLGEASPTDGEFLQKMAKRGSMQREASADWIAAYANYLLGEAAPTDNDGLKYMAELGKKNNLLNYIRYYGDTQVGGFLGVLDSLFGGSEDGWLAENHKGLMEEARENYDRIIESFPPFLRKTVKSTVPEVESWTDALLSLTGDLPDGLPAITRTYGKAKDEAARKGYSRELQTAYALDKSLREYFLIRTEGYDLNENDRAFLKLFGEYISEQEGIVEAIESADKERVPDLLESILMLAEEGLNRVLKGVEEPDPKDIPDIFDDLVDRHLDRAEEKVDAWEKDAWAPKETLPEEIWGLPEYDRSDGTDGGALLPAGGETDSGELWELPERTENTGKPDENWYTGDEEKAVPPKGPLPPNMTYQAGEFGYTYQTDEQGRISNWHADELQLTERSGRLPHVRNTPGKQSGDHAGHLAGDRFGGSGGLDNLVSQYWLVNLSSYRKLENDWKRAIQDGKTVDVNVRVEYAGNDLRPSAFSIAYAEKRAEKVYIYSDLEDGAIMARPAFRIDGEFYADYEWDKAIREGREVSSLSREEKRDMRRTILAYAVAVRELCLEYKRAVPTVIKLVYNAKTRQVEAKYSYERLTPLNEYADEARCRMWFDEIRAKNM